MDEILERILGIESEARAIVSEAQELATMLKEQAQEEAEQLFVRARERGEQEANALREQVRQEVEKEEARILSQTDQQPQPVEERDRFQEAVAYVVEGVSGQREGDA